MTAAGKLEYRQYLRLDMMPHLLCPGCGHGIVLKAILRAVHRLALPREEVVFVSGIGCSGRLVGYLDFCTLHTTHGRPLTFATGLKLARPDLHVVVITGDGDGLAIGGNHLIHAARRNIDMTCLLLNNAIYGMTGGQAAPTTPVGARSVITPRGAIEPSFDPCKLALGAGASFVARGLTAAPLGLDDLIAQAIEHKGFSFVEILSDCPEYFGRYNRLGKGPEMLQAQRRNTEWVLGPLAEKRFVPGFEAASGARPPEPPLASGVLHREIRPELTGEIVGLMDAGRQTDPPDLGSETDGPAGHEGEVARPEERPIVDAGVAAPERPGVTARAPQYQVRLAGAGGQGIVLAGLLLAEAAVNAGKNVTQAQAYGPESRGGASKAEVIVADGEIDYPCADRVDLLLALTQEAYERFASQLKPGGILVVDRDRVRVAPAAEVVCYALPILATARQVLGSTVGANLVALGAVVGLSAVVEPEAVERAVVRRQPGGSVEPGLRAFRAGLGLVVAPDGGLRQESGSRSRARSSA